MNDDGSSSEKPTQRLDAEDRSKVDESLSPPGSQNQKRTQKLETTSYPAGDKDAEEIFTSADTSAQTAPAGGEAEETEMISRDELFRNAALDRDKLRHKKKTVPVESVRVDDDTDTRPHRPSQLREQSSPADQTREMTQVDEETIEEVTVEEVHESLDGTAEFARHGISTLEDDRTVEFPGRIEEGPTVRIPVDVAVEIGLEAGDLVMIEVRKIED